MPPEVSQAGSVALTAFIHPLSARVPWWDKLAELHPERVNWPKESGGKKALARIFARCREMRAHPESLLPDGPDSVELGGMRDTYSVDRVLQGLTAPERERQRREMLAAMQRVCRLIYS